MTHLEQFFVFICWKQVQHFDTLAELKCSFSRMKAVIPTSPPICFQKYKSQRINYSLYHSLPGTWMTIFGGPSTRDALCSYKTASRLRCFEGLQWDHHYYYYDWQNSKRLLTPHGHHCAGNCIRTQPNNCLRKLHSLSAKTAIACALVHRKQFQKIYIFIHLFLQVSGHITWRSIPKNGTRFG